MEQKRIKMSEIIKKKNTANGPVAKKSKINKDAGNKTSR